jgi:hypothetical protein
MWPKRQHSSPADSAGAGSQTFVSTRRPLRGPGVATKPSWEVVRFPGSCAIRDRLTARKELLGWKRRYQPRIPQQIVLRPVTPGASRCARLRARTATQKRGRAGGDAAARSDHQKRFAERGARCRPQHLESSPGSEVSRGNEHPERHFLRDSFWRVTRGFTSGTCAEHPRFEGV